MAVKKKNNQILVQARSQTKSDKIKKKTDAQVLHE